MSTSVQHELACQRYVAAGHDRRNMQFHADRQPLEGTAVPRLANALDGRRRAVNTKSKEDVRERLERAAKENDRTLSNEIEVRLERSFEGEDRILSLFRSPARAAIMITINEAIGRSELATRQDISSDLTTEAAALIAVVEIVEFYSKLIGDIGDDCEREAIRIGRSAAIGAVKAVNPTLRNELFPDGLASPHDNWLREHAERMEAADLRSSVALAAGRSARPKSSKQSNDPKNP